MVESLEWTCANIVLAWLLCLRNIILSKVVLAAEVAVLLKLSSVFGRRVSAGGLWGVLEKLGCFFICKTGADIYT